MKLRTVILIIALCTSIVSCTNKQKQQNTIIGGADDTTEIVITEDSSKQDRDTVIYEIPQCRLWYTKELSEADKGEEIRMWTERKEYWEDVQVINVFVVNPTDVWWNFGRDWSLYVWNGTDWAKPVFKQSLSWTDDAFGIDKAPLLYCFRFPVGEYYHLPKGKYRLAKRFMANGKKLTLTTDFNICDTDVVPVKSLGTNGGGRVESK